MTSKEYADGVKLDHIIELRGKVLESAIHSLLVMAYFDGLMTGRDGAYDEVFKTLGWPRYKPEEMREGV